MQCFDFDEVRRLRRELNCPYRLIQLIADNTWGESDTDYNALRTPAGLAEVAKVADGIGPWLMHAYTLEPTDGVPVATGLVSAAHAQGLAVHPYTFRADQLPPGFASFADLVSFFVPELRIDGLFTDFPDQVIEMGLAAGKQT